MAKKKIRKISTLFLPALIFFIAGFFAFANLNYFSGIVGAVDNGGAFYIGSGSTFTLDSSKTISGFSSSSAGGGFYIASGGTMNITSGGVFKNSTTSSSGRGGGIYNAGTLNINGGIISENTSTSGGGIYSTGTIKMTDGTISGNNKSGSKSGDAVYLNGGTFTMSGGTISGNGGSTGQGNGCVYIGGNAFFTMSGGTIAQNKNMISCVYVSVGDFTLKGGTLDSIGGYGVFVDSGNTFTMEGGLISSSSTAVYSAGSVVLKGGTVNGYIECAQMNFYSNANILRNIRLFSPNGTICMEDYDGTTPSLNIIISNSSRSVGPVVTFVGSSTAPDMSKIKISGYDTNNYRLKTVKDSSGNWTISLAENSYDLPTTWKTEVASTSYMTTTVTPANLTSIKFVASVPSGYTQIGTLSTGLPVYKGTTATDIAFVGKKIYAPENSSKLFYNLSKLTTLDMSVFDTSKVTNMLQMFYNCKTLTSLDLSNFNTSKVTNMNYLFGDCSALTSLDVSGFNTANVTNMYGMFCDCSALTSLNVSNFVTSKVTDMGLMFYKCSALTSLDMSGFNTSNVTNMLDMFWSCSALTSLDVSGFYTSKVTNMGYMFKNCSALTSLDLSNFSTYKVTDMSSMFYNCSALTSLDLSSFNMARVTNLSDMLNFGSSNKIKTLKTPYNNSSAIAITTGLTLYNQANGQVVTSVPANNSSSLTLVHNHNYGSSSTSEYVDDGVNGHHLQTTQTCSECSYQNVTVGATENHSTTKSTVYAITPETHQALTTTQCRYCSYSKQIKGFAQSHTFSNGKCTVCDAPQLLFLPGKKQETLEEQDVIFEKEKQGQNFFVLKFVA